MYGELKKDIVEIIKKLCEMKQVELIDGRVATFFRPPVYRFPLVL